MNIPKWSPKTPVKGFDSYVIDTAKKKKKKKKRKKKSL